MCGERGAVPRLKASLPHTKTVHDSTGGCVLRLPDREQFFDGEPVECERRHAASGLTGQSLVPEIRMEAPSNLDGVSCETLEVFREGSVSAKVLDAPCTCDAFGLGLDEGPPTGSPRGPAPLHPGDHRRGLLSGFGLTTNVPHHLRETVHRIQSVEVTLVEGLQAKPLGVQGGGVQTMVPFVITVRRRVKETVTRPSNDVLLARCHESAPAARIPPRMAWSALRCGGPAATATASRRWSRHSGSCATSPERCHVQKPPEFAP
jgi:hypothetical protein